MRAFLSLSLAAALLSGCATAPLHQASLPAPPAAFAGPQTAGPAAALPASGQWWLVFNDPVLDDLMGRAMAGNSDLKLASAHLEQARALLKSAKADLWPQAGVAYSPSRSTNLLPPGKAANSHALDLDLSYEVDLFGRLSKAAHAANLDARSNEALLADTRLLVQSRVAQSYFALRALDEDRAIVADTLGTYRQSLEVTQKRFREGDVAELDVARLQTEVATTEAEGLALDQQRAELAHALATLIGEDATGFDVAAQAWNSEPWAAAVPVIPAGIPSQVLKQRPDVASAQDQLDAAALRVGVARAAWFPTLSLTAQGGYVSSDLGHLFDTASHSFTLAAVLSQAIFDGGRRNAGIDYAKGGLDAAFAGYHQTVLAAFQDVEDQLSDLDYLRKQQGAEDEAVAAANRAYTMSQSRYREGSSSQLDVLDAERSLLAIRRQALHVRAAQYQSSVGLIRAIGGAWTS
jgi:multidrug efflux system outer membrane protein